MIWKLFVPLILLSLAASLAQAQEEEEEAPPLTQEQIREKIFTPWSSHLGELQGALKPGRSYVAWIIVPPHTPLDMRSATMFRRFFLATKADRFSISHNLIAWQCQKADGTTVQGAAAITGESDEQSTKLMKGGFGLTPLFSVYTDGELQGTVDVIKEIEDEKKEKGQATVVFEVPQEKCENMMNFISDFALHPSKPYEKFSNVLSPDKMQGGGCVTLAEALLKRAGIFENVLALFHRKFRVNRFLLGGNMPLPKDTANVKMPKLPWLRGASHKVALPVLMSLPWDSSSATAVPIDLMDPEMMLYSFRALSQEYLRTVPAAERAKETKEFAHSSFGQRTVKSAVGGLLYYNKKEGRSKNVERIVINEEFDDIVPELASQARKWLAGAERDGLSLRRASMNGSPVLILDKP